MGNFTTGANDDFYLSEKTMGSKTAARLIVATMGNNKKPDDDVIHHGLLITNSIHSYRYSAVQSGHELPQLELARHTDKFAYTVRKPSLVKSYEILHDNASANGLTFPKENRKFGGGAQYNGGNNVIKLTFPKPIGEAMTLVFWYYSIATQSVSSEGLISYTNRNSNVNYITTNEASKTITFNTGNRNLTANGLIQGWNHIVITAKNGEQKIYVNNRVRTARNYNYIDRTIYPIFIFGRYYGVAQHPSNKLAWLSFCKGLADSLWVANDYNGIRDFSDTSPVQEITTIPFDGGLGAKPNSTSGTFQG